MCESVDHWRFKNRSQTLLVFVSKNLSTSLNKAVKNRHSNNNNSFKVYKHKIDSSNNTIFSESTSPQLWRASQISLAICVKLEFAPDPSVNFLFWSTQLIPGSSIALFLAIGLQLSSVFAISSSFIEKDFNQNMVISQLNPSTLHSSSWLNFASN